MELGDLLRSTAAVPLLPSGEKVAILAIMELGDLLAEDLNKSQQRISRNPRYNGIGWFTTIKFKLLYLL